MEQRQRDYTEERKNRLRQEQFALGAKRIHPKDREGPQEGQGRPLSRWFYRK